MFVSKLILRSIAAELTGLGFSSTCSALHAENLSEERWAALHGPDVDRFVARALHASEDPGLGLSLGRQVPESMLRVVGHLLLTCETLREAIGMLRQYSGLLLGGLEWRLFEREDVAVFGFTKPEAAPDTQRFWADWMLMLALRVGRRYAGEPQGSPHSVLLAHPVTSYAERYRSLFGCEVHFDQATYGITFSACLLDKRQAHADAVLTRVLRETADTLHRQVTGESSFAERVRHALGYEADLVNLDFHALAARWGVTRRTLRRRLNEEGVSLTQLLEEACCRKAEEQLRRPHESIKEIASRLGYSEVSAFHRAFKRWTGETPTEYRRRVLRAPERAQLAS
jgi:AraC-like DNA-binding protein